MNGWLVDWLLVDWFIGCWVAIVANAEKNALLLPHTNGHF